MWRPPLNPYVGRLEVRFSVDTGGKIYRTLVIEASSPDTDIWLGDDEGHLVQKDTGTLNTHVLDGHYTVEFGLGTTTYPIHFDGRRSIHRRTDKEGAELPEAHTEHRAITATGSGSTHEDRYRQTDREGTD